MILICSNCGNVFDTDQEVGVSCDGEDYCEDCAVELGLV